MTVRRLPYCAAVTVHKAYTCIAYIAFAIKSLIDRRKKQPIYCSSYPDPDGVISPFYFETSGVSYTTKNEANTCAQRGKRNKKHIVLHSGCRTLLWLPYRTVATVLYGGYRTVRWLPYCTAVALLYGGYRTVRWLPYCAASTVL